ncbi:MAG: alpha-E domain-containing protein, partial [Inhella sp.]
VVPTFPSSETTRGFAPFRADELDEAALMQLAARIDVDPAAHTLKERVRPSQQPVWRDGRLEPRSAVLRVFALAHGSGSAGGWTVLPGGLTRVAQQRGGGTDALLTMQAGCASCDTWVLAESAQAVDPTSLLPPPLRPEELAGAQRIISSRAAENLFWLGRYTERAENSLRLTRLALTELAASARGDERSPASLDVIDTLARRHGLVKLEAPEALQQPQRFQQHLLAALGDARSSHSVAFNLAQLARCAETLRDRLSPTLWQLLQGLGDSFAERLRAALRDAEPELQPALAATDQELAALTGGQLDRMTRDDGWRLLSIGRQIERLHFLADVLLQGDEVGLTQDEDGFALLLALFDSSITYRAQFPGRRERAALLQLLVMDENNPRSLAWVAGTLRERLLKLSAHDPNWAHAMQASLPAPAHWQLAGLLGEGALRDLLQTCNAQVLQLASAIDQRFFAHVSAAERRIWK